MPALRLLGRRWMFASDDLVFPSLIEIPYRLLWLVMLSLVAHDSLIKLCPFDSLGRITVVLSVALQVMMLMNLVATAQQSARGALIDVEQRKYVAPLLLGKLFLMLVEIALNIMGVYWIFFHKNTCPLSTFATTVMQCLLILTWIPLLQMFLAIYIAYDPLGTIEYDDLTTVEEKEDYHRKSTKIWVSRVQWTFWYFKDSKMEDAVYEMAALLSMLFKSIDIVLYDLIAGSILLRVRQKRETRERRASDVFDAAEVKYTTDLRKIYAGAPSWMTMDEAYHYLRLATSAYGWVYVLYRFYCTGMCLLAPYLRCCCHRPQNVVGDNCCMCNYAGLKYLSQASDSDLIYVSYENHIFEVPFYVLAEHNRKRIVVVIRGSNSIHDMFTDLTAPAESFEAEGLPENSSGHKGMILSTEKTLERLMPILERTFAEYPDYDLVITGHSLGAGVSILLGIKLKPKYPNLKVFAFSAPSGLLTREAARYTESFVMTVGVGDDLVMRISLKSAQSFRDRLIETIGMTKLPKYRILLNGLWYMLFSIPAKDLDHTWKSNDDMEAQLVGPPRLTRSLSQEVEQLHIAGRILHITRNKTDITEKNAPKFKMCWASPEDFKHLVVMPRMLLDHMPENVLEPIKKILEECSTSPDNRDLQP